MMRSLRPSLLTTRRGGFTLLEIIVVIGIIFLLMLLAVPAYFRSMRNGKAAACMGHLRQIGLGLNSYLSDHEMTMPAMEAGRRDRSEDVPVLDTTLAKYVRDARVFACPDDRKKFAEKTGTSYFWNVAMNGQKVGNLNFLQLIKEQSRIPLVSDKEQFHPYSENKINVLYADGSASQSLKFVVPEPEPQQ